MDYAQGFIMRFSVMKTDGTRSKKWPKTTTRYLISLLLLAVSICTIGCEGPRSVQGRELCDSIETLLIAEKLCSDKNDCTRKQYVFYKGSTDVDLWVYGITDKSLVKQIVDLCIEKHANNPGMQYTLTMYSQTRSQDGYAIFSKSPILQLTLKKEE